jgi:two-component system cell cycle response regulator
MKILVADDSKTNLAIITAALKKLGHDVYPANNGQQAIEQFQAIRPDLIILDVVMDNMNGFECARTIRQINSEDWIPIIFLSASVDDESIAQGINAGGDDYLTKPFSEITLGAKIIAMQRISDMRQKLFAATQQLSILSSTDPLTGLYNRLQFEKSMAEKISHAQRNLTSFALFFIDLDHFKEINDQRGHHMGDLLLKNVAQRLKSCLRKEDFIARLGGDEFAIILSDLSPPNITEQIAKKIIDILVPTYQLEGHNVQTTCSLGIAFYPQHGMNTAELTQNADIAMYHAKQLGRNNFQLYHVELRSLATLEKHIEATK